MITGSMVALVTPMHSDGSVDWASLNALLQWHMQAGTKAIVAVGTTGESATLSVGEHLSVIRFAVERVAGKIPVIAGTGANSTSEAIELNNAAQEAGADAALSVTPYYNKPTQKGLFEHFKAIVEATKFPTILYNVPGRTACDMSNDVVVDLAQVPGVIGIKDATGDLTRGADLVARCPKDFALYSGDDASALDFILQGGHGSISVTANVAPAVLAQALDHALAGEAEQAKALDAKLADLHRDLFVESNPIPVKYALATMGKIETGIRLPLTELEPTSQPAIKAALAAANIEI